MTQQHESNDENDDDKKMNTNLIPSSSTTQSETDKEKDSEIKNVSVGSNSYLLSKSTAVSESTGTETLTDCAPSRESASASSLNKSMDHPQSQSQSRSRLQSQLLSATSPTQQLPQGQQRLYLSKPDTERQTDNSRPIPNTGTTAPTESSAVDDDIDTNNVNHDPNQNQNDETDLEAPTPPEVYVQAEVARDMDSVVNQAVSEALRERDRNVVSAVHVETAPEEDPDPKFSNNHQLLAEAEIKHLRRQRFIYVGFGAFIVTLILAIVLLTGVLDLNPNPDPDNVRVLNNQTNTTANGTTATASPSSLSFLSLSSDLPLQLCQGNCNRDQDCDEGLMCMERIEGNLHDVPGCSGKVEDFQSINFCIVKTLTRLRETNRFPLGLCEGDCDSDVDCNTGMICFQRNSFEPVPQCFGGENDESQTDYCVPPEPTANPSTSPTGPTLWPALPPSVAPTPNPSVATTLNPTIDPFRIGAIDASLGDDLLPYHPEARKWLLQTDTWLPPEEAADPSGLWRERYAFVTLYFATNGPFWPTQTQGRWLSNESVCQWNKGIRCNMDGKVDYLDIVDWSRIVGSILSELKALTMLSHLGFSSHELGGSFPTDIMSLTLLTRLDLRSNELSGVIPTEIGLLSKLQVLDLRRNNLVGRLPSEIGRLTDLRNNFLDENLISGSIPTHIGQLTALQGLWAYNNRLNGPLPSELGLLTNMEYLHLYDNDLTGPIISEIGQLTNMDWLSLYDNAFERNIPTEIGRLTNMWFLDLSSNRLTGLVPFEFGNLYLEALNLARNQLTGTFPVMTFVSRNSEPRCFIESNRFNDTSSVQNVCQV
ncbi:unnamed protein product [Cylindrotheca closterium]|uniref:Disease resistance R13L4/SHOC-2-like LRR domain-containing protein n=1 Tax=Cylindrotheca closterium TaxID=2856 RepID=A0AAD2FGQ6_9STRA|nr:unnamed protein product [Cylindrotheca closterium]